MSSPFVLPNDGVPNRSSASSPAPSAKEAHGSQDPENISVRPMSLKVLYTFDDQNKTNCLARWPHILNVRTAYLDENTQIGIAELKTCIQTIVAASPELVAKLGQDYTVYAYDYSEYETPLVGHGMLSWVLASSSAIPAAPAHQISHFVTGRVCKNILGLFSSGTHETLEVKLRLVPVPTCLQSEYLESMRTYRNISLMAPEGFDSQAWMNFLQANPGMLTLAEQSRSQSPASGFGPKEVGIEHVQRLLSDVSGIHNARDQLPHQRNDNIEGPISQDPSRAASPALGTQSTGARSSARGRGRAGSKALGRGRKTRDSLKQSSADYDYISNDDRGEEGPVKKRAKVTKAKKVSAKAGFGNQADSLRVAASTAASVRVFQPTAIRPPGNPIDSTEDTPRAPTPTPPATNQSLRPALPPARSRLGCELISMEKAEYSSPYVSAETLKLPLETTTSPEDRRSCTPRDPASSPPVIPVIPVIPATSPAPSSPSLPTLPCPVDSGFMSGNFDELFGSDDDDEDRPLEDLDFEIAAQYIRRDTTLPRASDSVNGVEDEGPRNNTPQQQQIKHDEVRQSEEAAQKAETQKALEKAPQKTAGQIILYTPKHTPQPVIPQVPQDAKTLDISRRQAMRAVCRRTESSAGNAKGKPRNLRRSQTWGGQPVTSDASIGSDGPEAPRPKQRSWSKVKRAQSIQSKLATSIAAGEMPPFCENCGAIETPTWRKAFSKVYSGGTVNVHFSDGEGGVVGCHVLEKDNDDNTTLFRIYKKSLLPSDAGFAEVLLCNPCGLWLHNHKDLRPQNVWEQARKRRDDNKRPPGNRRRRAKTNEKPTGSANLGSESLSQASDASSPVDSAANGTPDEAVDGSMENKEKDDDMKLPPTKSQRSLSEQVGATNRPHLDSPINAAVRAELQRAIQSSPARFLGSKYVPIQLDDKSPKPIRRALFPSPNRLYEPGSHSGSSDGLKMQSVTGTPKSISLHTAVGDHQANKENLPPETLGENDSIDDLFDECPRRSSCPSTPKTDGRLPANPFETPTKMSASKLNFTSSDFFSSAAKAFLHLPKTPTRTPSKQPLSMFLSPFSSEMHRLMSDAVSQTSPSKFLDFSSLSALDSQSPGNYFQSDDFADFELRPSDVIGEMPSSPPRWFGVYEDLETDGVGAVSSEGWEGLEFRCSPLREIGDNAEAVSEKLTDAVADVGTDVGTDVVIAGGESVEA